MFRRFRLTSSVFKAVSVGFGNWLFNSSSSSFENRFGRSVTEILDSGVVDVAEYQSEKEIDPNVADMSVREFLANRSSIKKSCEVKNLESMLKKNLLASVFQSMTRESTRWLIPGSVHRHTRVLPYGMLAREDNLNLMNKYFNDLKYFRYRTTNNNVQIDVQSVPKEFLPLGILVALPRQGKTLFLDSVGNDADRTSFFLDDDAAMSSREVVFVFNITFNSTWQVVANKNAKITVAEAVHQISLRLVSAASGIFVKHGTQRQKDVETILKLCSPSLADVMSMLQSRLQEIYDCCTPCLILLMDEVTELAAQVEIPAEFYSELTSILSPSCAVVVSGFTIEGSGLMTKSDRPIYQCDLPSLSNAQMRRSIAPMITMYFQRLHSTFVVVANSKITGIRNNSNNNIGGKIPSTLAKRSSDLVRHSFRSALFVFELMKSTPGIFGAVLEKMDTIVKDGTSVHALLSSIPFLKSLGASFYDAARKVLRWKSLQFCPCDLDNSTPFPPPHRSISKKSFLDMIEDCNAAGNDKYVYVGTGRISWEVATTSATSQNKTLGEAKAEFAVARSAIVTTTTSKSNEEKEVEQLYKRWYSEDVKDVRIATPLSSIGVEPTLLFMNVSGVGVNIWFDCFRTMLMNFSSAFYVLAFCPLPPNSSATDYQTDYYFNINNNNEELAEFQREFDCFGLTTDNATKGMSFPGKCEELVKRMIQLRFQVDVHSTKDHGTILGFFDGNQIPVNYYISQLKNINLHSQNEKNTNTTEPRINIYLDKATRRQDTTLHGYFFEDATAIGICAQKELRATVAQRLPHYQSSLACSVDRFLANTAIGSSSQRFKYDRATRVFSQLPERDIIIRWLDEQLVPPNEPVQFVGHYPVQNEVAPQILKIDNTTGAVSKSALRVAEHFNRETVLVPSRPENNPLVDVIFHELLEGLDGSSTYDVVQFWVDVKHRQANQHADAFAGHVVNALQSPLLASTSVKHVVHIIVATNAANDNVAEAEQRNSEVEKALQRHAHFTNGAGSNSSPSYSLYIIHPDSFAFENLVSQPIARAMPSMDQQLMESWRQRLGVVPDWRKYKTTTSSGLERLIRSPDEFCEWRQLRLKDDGISTLEACLPSHERELYFIKNFSGLSDSSQHQLATMCFGLFLEHFNVIHYSNNKNHVLTFTGNSISNRISVKCRPGETRVDKILLGERGADESKCVQVEVLPFRFQNFVRRSVRLGHLIDGHFTEYTANSNIWNFLFDSHFVAVLETLIGELSSDELWRKCFGAIDRHPAVIGKILWNMPMNQWTRTWSLFCQHKYAIDVTRHFDVRRFNDCFKQDVPFHSEICQSETLCFALWVMHSRTAHLGVSAFVKKINDTCAALDRRLVG